MGFLGSSALSDIKFGSSAVSKVYRGSSLVWQPTAGPTFNLVSYSGNGSTRSITGVGFEPGMVWFANSGSGQTYDPIVFDQRRGATRFIKTNGVGKEYIDAQSLTSFDADGFSLGTSATVNNATRTFDVFCWAPLGNAATDTNGTITSTTQTNLAAGYSVFTYNGNNTQNSTVGHGLDSAPEYVFIQSRTDGFSYSAQCHSSLLAPSFPTGISWGLNSTSAATATTQYIRAVNSSTLTLSSDNTINGPASNNFTHVGFAFKSVPGVSKLGLVTGDGSGVLNVDCGFSPKMLLIKTYIGTGIWQLGRRTNDTTGYITYYNFGSSAVPTLSTDTQITANGFSIDSGGYGNVVGSTSSIWYMAYA